MPETGEIVSKGDFARLCGVTPGRVSQWIAEGKMSRAALVGDGRAAKVNVAVASADLKLRLDTNQRLGLNGLTTSIPVAPIAAPIAEASPAAIPMPPPSDPVEERIKREKLRQAELTTQRLEREDREAHGLYMRTSAAREEMGRIAGTLLTVFEGGLVDISAAIATRFELNNRDVLHLLRHEFRALRGRAAESIRQSIDEESALIVDEEVPPND